MGNYFCALKCLVELLSDEVVEPPPITKKTIELGFKYSPESVCIPFKYNLGNYIEALEKGANVLVQSCGGCRFGHYGELQQEILTKLGYKFEFIRFEFIKPANDFNFLSPIKNFKRLNPAVSYCKIISKFTLCFFKIRYLDYIEDIIRKNIGFEKNKGEFEKSHRAFLAELESADTIRKIYFLKKKYKKQISKIKLEKPDKPFKVGIIGELYSLMEPFSNFYLEKELAKKGIEVHRFITVSSILHEVFSGRRYLNRHIKNAKPYLKYQLGAHGTESVSRAISLIKQKFDGIIHLKPFGCMPEVSAISALNRISKDYKFPIIYFSFDSQTSETGIKTRLEAFHDMLLMKKNKTFSLQNSYAKK